MNEPNVPDDAKLKEYITLLSLKPPSIEKCGVEMLIDLIKQHKMKIHLTDVSSSDCLSLVKKYRNQRTDKQSTITVETSHHYLTLASEEIGNGKTEFKCSPPIRNDRNKSRLWDGIKSYEFNNVSSSHLPSSIKTKCLIGGKNRGNFIEASNGISSLQFALPVFWSECLRNNMSIHDVHRFMSYHPAKLCGLDSNKGKLKVGYDADFCIWDPDEEWTISKEETLFMNKISPYYGKQVKGRVRATVVRGYFVYDSHHPNKFDEPIGNVILKRPMKRSERTLTFNINDNEPNNEAPEDEIEEM
jgi:allantoinase